MPDPSNLSEIRQALLEKMLRGNPPQAEKATNAISRRSQDGPVPLSFNQEQFWLLSQLTPDTSAANIGSRIHLPGPLDVAALEQSLQEISRRHEAWRTSFPLVNDAPVQLIHPPSAFSLSVVDLQDVPVAEREDEANRLGTALVEQPFDLAKAPPIRMLLVRLESVSHYLFVAQHHIISDGFSANQVFLPELQALYQALSTGQPSPLPELPIQYADYALWQHETLQGAVLENHLAYWKEHLAGAPTELALPTDHPRSSTSTTQKGAYAFNLPATLSKTLEALGHQEGATLFMTLLAAYGTLLYRYCGQDDIVIGTPSSGRTRPEVRELLGDFINTLPVRLDLSGNPSFLDLLKRAREAMLGGLAHEELPFGQLVQHLQPERVAGQNPIFQALFTLQPPMSPLSSGWRASQLISQVHPDHIDLILDLEERPEGLSGAFYYNPDLFEAATIERLFGHWQTLLDGILANPHQPVATLPLLTPAERQQMLVNWNATETPYPYDQCFHQLFEEQAADRPEAVAVVYDGQQMTYRQLNERANQLAHHLRQLGVGPEVLVGLYMNRSLELLVAVLGIHKAGGAYVPIDPSYPPERTAYILEDSQAPALLTQAALLGNLPDHRARIVCLDQDWPTIDEQPKTNPVSGVKPGNLAYIICTSGSTGKPKGVLVTHRGLPNLATALHHLYHTDAASRVLEVASFSFDASVADMLTALPFGGTLYLANEEERIPGPALIRLLREQEITVAVLMPTLLATLDPDELPALKVLITAGEACSADLVTKWTKPGRVFLNVYGPTEATVAATWAECVDDGQAPPIGRPLFNTQVYVLDSYLQPVPLGITGELYIGGIGLANGYHNRPDLTAEKFIQHPFSQKSGAKLYRTGDLVRWRADGNLEFVGRIDQQVKIRGFRIELGEIENTLAQHPAVREAVVVAREDSPGGKRLVAYLVPTGHDLLTSVALHSFLKDRLPAYMIPAAFVLLEAMPLNPNGKTDRRALPAPEGASLQAEADFVAPRTPTEERLASIWMDMLGLKQVGIHANFFDLGGHSLLALRVIARIQDYFQVQLPLSSLFEAPTIADLALKIVQNQAEQVDTVTLDQLLAELEEISDDDIQAMLALEKQTENEGR